MKKEFYVGIILPDKSTIIKKVENHDSIESIMEFMEFNFGNNNYFIKEIDELYTKYYRVKNNKLNLIGNINLLFELDKIGMFYIGKNYPILLNNEFIDLEVFEEENSIYDYFIYEMGNKILTINKYIGKLTMEYIYQIIENFYKHIKYLEWILKISCEKLIDEEDNDKINNLLNDFDKPMIKALLKRNNYSIDIMDYKNSNILFETIDKVYYSEQENLGNKQEVINRTKIFENEKWLVCEPKTHFESKELGSGTYWCTAADSENSKDTFRVYLERGKLIIFINKITNEKFQFHYFSKYNSEQFLNKFDENFLINEVFDTDFIKNYYSTIRQNKLLTEIDSYISSEFKMELCHNLIDLDIFENDKNIEVSNMAKVKKYYT